MSPIGVISRTLSFLLVRRFQHTHASNAINTSTRNPPPPPAAAAINVVETVDASPIMFASIVVSIASALVSATVSGLDAPVAVVVAFSTAIVVSPVPSITPIVVAPGGVGTPAGVGGGLGVGWPVGGVGVGAGVGGFGHVASDTTRTSKPVGHAVMPLVELPSTKNLDWHTP